MVRLVKKKKTLYVENKSSQSNNNNNNKKCVRVRQHGVYKKLPKQTRSPVSPHEGAYRVYSAIKILCVVTRTFRSAASHTSVNCFTKLTDSDGGTAACVNILGQVQHQSLEPSPLNHTHHGNIPDKRGLCTHMWPCQLSHEWKMLCGSGRRCRSSDVTVLISVSGQTRGKTTVKQETRLSFHRKHSADLFGLSATRVFYSSGS